ncbi:hypothetical protein E1281_23280 [Actinomadura sp. KC345]|uniref:hypothetical protein n=1 Tax=Actinomadura sp. KC345 TaxID=2530371 RepID=UPI0010518AC7|nr:hypothetical protein [Actinomadura sp. KC345]TDC49458.1 hypothetical protein E1281_23280 [Actinomadura sp. KC345]
MTTDPHDEHGEILRRALNAEADSVNPAGDGLERIRARIADGSGRRFGLGRFGPAGFGFDRFTVNWARPVLAVAAAVAVAGLGVTAPQTIDLIQQSVGANGSQGGGHDHAVGGHTATQGDPGSPGPTAPGGSASGSPSTAETPNAGSPPGTASCGVQPPPESPTIAASPGSKSAAPTPEPCPSGTASQAPTTTPTPPTSTSPDPDKPTQVPTTPAPSESTKSADQGSAEAGTP